MEAHLGQSKLHEIKYNYKNVRTGHKELKDINSYSSIL